MRIGIGVSYTGCSTAHLTRMNIVAADYIVNDLLIRIIIIAALPEPRDKSSENVNITVADGRSCDNHMRQSCSG